MTNIALSQSPRIGVVIIGRNEGQRLVAALRSAGTGSHAVVYVDSGSTDGSVMAAQQAGATVVPLDMTMPFSAARARNAGFATLLERDREIELVQFIDGDCELNDRWIDTATAFLSAHREVALVCGRRRERFPERSIYNRLCDIEWDTPVGNTQECGGDFLVRVEAFRQVAGFSERMIAGEEPELCARLRAAGWRIWRLDAEMTLHDANILHLWQWWRRAVRCGYAYASLARLHGNGPDRLRKRHVKSALIWGGAVPALITAGTLIYPPFIAAAAVYGLQALRIGLRGAHKGKDGLLFGASVMLGKFAECIGIAKFAVARLRGREQPLIEYK